MQKLTLMFGVRILLYMGDLGSGLPIDGEGSAKLRTESESFKRDFANLCKLKSRQVHLQPKHPHLVINQQNRLTQLDTNSIVGFVPRVFDYEEPNFVENRSKFRNDPNKMKDIRKAAIEKSKKAVEKSSRLSKTDDSGRPRLPKGMKYRIRKVPVHLLHFDSYCNRKFGEEIKNYFGEEIEQDNPDKIHVCVKGTTLKFTIIKYAIISDLKCSGNIEEHLFYVTSKSTLMTKYFPGSKSSVKRSFFIKRFKLGNFENNFGALNMSIIYSIHTFLYSQVYDSTISKLNFVMVENGSYKQFSWGKSSFEKLIALWRGMPHVLNVWMYECCSEVVGIKVKYEKFMVGMFSKFVYNNIRPTHEEVQTLDLQMIEGFQLKEAESEFPSEIAADYFDKRPASTYSPKQVHVLDGSTVGEKSTQAQVDEMDIMQNIEGIQKGGEGKIGNVPSKEDVEDIEIFKTLKEKGKRFSTRQINQQTYTLLMIQWMITILIRTDVEGFSEDNTTASLDALVEFMVNHNFDNTNVKTSTTVHVHNDHMDVEGVSADIGPATLKCLIAAVKNQKPDNNNVGTSNMQVDYSSTLSELAQVELDTILKVITAPVNDVPIEVVPPTGLVVNQHNISDSQLPLDFSDAVVAAHQAAKISTKVAKRIRTRSKVFKSPYTSEYVSGSKAIEDQIEEQKQQFVFDDFLISDTMPSSVIEEFKQWMEEGLLKFHAKKTY
ncbi:hypothetical protein P3S68_014401 [Capsicum galapagoense]